MSVTVKGPDGNVYQFPDGTDKATAIGYFKKKGIGETPARALERRAMDPGSSYKPTTVSTGQVRPESGAGKFMEGAVHAASPVLATVGGVLGSAAGPAGAMAGAAVGGGIGKAIETHAETGKTNLGQVYDASVGQGLLEAVGGQLVPKAIKAAGKAVNADKAMAKILGLRVSKKLSIPEAIEEIGKVVNKEVGGAATLGHLGSKIASAKEALIQGTEHIIQNTTGTRLVPWDKIVYDQGLKAIDIAEAQGLPTKPIDTLVDVLQKKASANALPKDMLDIRRTLLKEKDASGQAIWPAGTKRFRQMLYHEVNAGIRSALPPKEAAQFAANNYKVSKLIMAEEAVTNRLAKRVTGQEGGRGGMEHAIGIARAGALPVIGAAEGARETHSIKGAVAGAVIGYGASRGLGSTGAKSLGLGARKALEKYAPRLSTASKAIPMVARALEAIQGATANK